jgi:NADPH:quinone reductase-like Zn-dependent oxidoreductase
MMKAIRVHGYGGPEVLTLDNIAIPEPGPAELRVRVHAAGVNPVDWKIRAGYAQAMIDPPLPFIPGAEIAGTVDAVGDGVEGWQAGDAVMAMIGLWGGYAEYAIVWAVLAVPKPKNIVFAQAAAAPLSAQTAWGALAGLQTGQRLMIRGAAGGVGSAAVQIGRIKGAEVIATASLRSADRVRALGADRVIAYDAPVAETMPEVDMILDLVGDPAIETLHRLKADGLYVTAVLPDDVEKAAAAGRRAEFFGIMPDGAQLATVVEHIASGAIRLAPPIVFALDRAADAQRLSETGHAPARIVLAMPAGNIN